MPSPFLPVPAGLIPLAEAAKRLGVAENMVRRYFGPFRGRPAWLSRWLVAHGERLSRPTLIPRILANGKPGRFTYVKESDVATIQRAKAGGRAEVRPNGVVHKGELCISVTEFVRRSGMRPSTVYFRVRQGTLRSVRKRPSNDLRLPGSLPTIYLPVSELSTAAESKD